MRILVHESTLDAAGATRLLQGEELGRLGLARLLGRQPPDYLRAVDLMLVPHWYVSFRVVVAAARGEHVAPALWTMLQALSGTVLRLPTPPPLVERELADLAPALALPPRLGRGLLRRLQSRLEAGALGWLGEGYVVKALKP